MEQLYTRLYYSSKKLYKLNSYFYKLYKLHYSTNSFTNSKEAIDCFSYNMVRCLKYNKDALSITTKDVYYKDIIINGRSVRSGVGAVATRNILNMLVEEGLIQWDKGYRYDDNSRELGKITLTQDFIIDILNKVNIEDVTIRPDLNVLILRDKSKNQVEFEHSRKITNMISDLQDYNKFMNSFDVRDYQGDKINTDLTRIFNEDFEHGGRLYTGAGGYQQIPSHLRKGITIDGEYLKELDIKGSHIAILYTLEGHILGKGYDPYQIDEVDAVEYTVEYGLAQEYIDEKYDPKRNIIKLALVVMINSKSRQSAIKALTNKVNKANKNSLVSYLERLDDLKLDTPEAKELISEMQALKYVGIVVEDMSKLLDAIEHKHKAIKKYFYTGVGLVGQKLEGDIMQRTLTELKDKGLPSLCIHDSIMVREGDIPIAVLALRDAWGCCVGDTYNLSLTDNLY